MKDEVNTYLQHIKNEKMRADSIRLVTIMQEETGAEPYMWGKSIIGFGSYHYKYASGREGDTVVVGFSARRQALTLYGIIFYDEGTELLSKLGPCTTGKGCLYIKHLADVDETVLRTMIKNAFISKAITT